LIEEKFNFKNQSTVWTEVNIEISNKENDQQIESKVSRSGLDKRILLFPEYSQAIRA